MTPQEITAAEQRILAAFHEARKRDGVPYKVIDLKKEQLRSTLSALKRIEEGTDVKERQKVPELRRKLLEEAEEYFTRVRDMDPRQFNTLIPRVNVPPPSLEQRLSGLVDGLMKRGIVFEVLRPSTLVVSPASKLTQQERDTIVPLKKEIMALIERRKDAWIV